MVNSITLTSSMRSNLQSLKTISTQMDKTQERLSTGKDVNSALDNASSYYQARALTNRASDLDSLLDSMGQGIQTLSAASEGIEIGLTFLEQAKAVANNAASKETPIVAQVSTEEELLAAVNSGREGLIVLEKDIALSINQKIVLKDNQSIVGKGYLDGTKARTKLILNFDNTYENSAVNLGNNTLISNVDFDISLNEYKAKTDFCAIKSHDKKGIVLQDSDFNLNRSGHASYCASSIVFSESEAVLKGDLNINCTGGMVRGIHVYAMSKVKTDNCKINIKNEGWQSRGVVIAYNNALFDVKNNSVLNINVIGQEAIGLHNHSGKTTILDSQINILSDYFGILNEVVGGFEAQKDSEINIKSVHHSVMGSFKICNQAKIYLELENLGSSIYKGNDEVLEIASGALVTIKNSNGVMSVIAADYYDNVEGGLTAQNLLSVVGGVEFSTPALPDWNKIEEEINNPTDSQKTIEEKPNKEGIFENILQEYDKLIEASSYQGCNLLNGGELTLTFNESRSHRFTVFGCDIRAENMGIVTREWTSVKDIEKSISELIDAINKLREYSEAFGNQYQLIQTRQNFTDALIDVLETGADNLVLADMNEESANYLALQTRQQLATNSLSLASQSAQSILSLF